MQIKHCCLRTTSTARALPQVSCTVDGEAFAMPDPKPLLMPASRHCVASHTSHPQPLLLSRGHLWQRWPALSAMLHHPAD